MKLFSFRRTIAALAAAVTLSASMLGSQAQATSYHHGAKYLQVFSMSYVDDARAKARHLRNKGFEDATVFKSSNGFYAVVAGKVPYGSEHVVHKLKKWGKIPHDSFLTTGKHYVKQIAIYGHNKHYGNHGVSGYKPAHKPVHKPARKRHYNGHVVYYY